MRAGEPESRGTGEPGTDKSAIRPPSSVLSSWLQLVRVPNFLTVPGDVLAGYLLATGANAQPDAHLAAAIGASLFMYAGGLILNDLSDLDVDLKERPNRPLPSGRISKAAAQIAMGLCFVAALGLARFAGGGVFQCGILLAVLVVVYNQSAKKHPVGGPLTMGACRGFNILLGASLVQIFPIRVWICALIEILYIARVTSMARNETSGGKVTPKVIGSLISLLLPIQAAFCLASGAGKTAWLAAALLLVLWPLHRILARKFYAS